MIASLLGAALNAEPRKLSIANWAAGRKDFISFSAAGDSAGRDLGARMSRRSDRQRAQRSERAAVAEAEMHRTVAVDIKYHRHYVHNGALDTFVGANGGKDVVAGSGGRPQAWRRGAQLLVRQGFRHDFAIVPRLGVVSL